MPKHPDPTPAAPDGTTLARNLRALALRSPRAAKAVHESTGDPRVELQRASDGGLTGVMDGQRLASRFQPRLEGERFAARVDLESTACAVVLGFGVGHHVAELSRRMGDAGIVVAFEPDVRLLRGVLEREDYSAALASGNLVVLTGEPDSAEIAAAVSGCEGLLAIGTKLLMHPPSKARIGVAADRFGAAFAHVMKAVRTHVLTSLVQVEATVRNQLQNVDHYVRSEGIADLAGMARGRAAIVVSAGPSLARNIEALAQPGVRERFIIIAVQTVLKPLLERGIKPHYVTALDHHEISRRFYEGLTREDVRGVTLVAEAKCNPAILAAFPGEVRCPADGVLDRVLGEALLRARGEIAPGATVAHLAYYFARHLGCEPVILVGQDLGFTDGQYYAAGAAIHQVWSGELNEFNTLEMLEWQRIARMKNLLRPATDVLGRAIYTDEQMSTYLVQFERDFAKDAQRGLTIVDATEGGVRKQHTRVMPLREVVAEFGACAATGAGDTAGVVGVVGRTTCALNDSASGRAIAAGDAKAARDGDACVKQARAQLVGVRRDASAIQRLSREAEALLAELSGVLTDTPRANRIIERVHRLRDEVTSMRTAYWLSHFLNQAGTLNRFKADRAMKLDARADEAAKLERQVERDRTNVRWLGEAAENVGRLLDDAIASLDGKPKVTRDVLAPSAEVGAASSVRKRVLAVVHADTERSGLDTLRDLLALIHGGACALELTLRRLARCRELDGIAIATNDAERVRPIVERVAAALPPLAPRITIAGVEPSLLRRNARAIAMGRLWSRWCWRGGIAGLSIHDEALRPGVASTLLERLGSDAACIVGADWCLIDPALVDRVVARYREQPERNPMAFAHAPPGLGACVIDRAVLEEWARVGGSFATAGALLGYIPVAPQADPIAKPACISVSPGVRDLGMRLIADGDGASRGGISRVLEALGEGADADAIVHHLAAHPDEDALAIEHVVINLGGASRGWLDRHAASALIESVRGAHLVAISLVGDDDPVDHPHLGELTRNLRSAGIAGMHVRTPLWGDPDRVESLLDVGVDVVSVDLHADREETYRAITGRDRFDVARANLDLLLTLRGDGRGNEIPTPWIVPRLTRRDAVYEQIQDFYDRWVMRCGACVIDPLPAPIEGERIAPLPVPRNVVARRERTMLLVSATGVATRPSGALVGRVGEASFRAALGIDGTPANAMERAA